jgi:hypothetical protein
VIGTGASGTGSAKSSHAKSTRQRERRQPSVAASRARIGPRGLPIGQRARLPVAMRAASSSSAALSPAATRAETAASTASRNCACRSSSGARFGQPQVDQGGVGGHAFGPDGFGQIVPRDQHRHIGPPQPRLRCPP